MIEKVLIVDDELLIRNFMAETLRRKGLDVITAENGRKALQILKDTSFDLVITDMKMPDISGMEILKKTKELYPSCFVIVITAFGTIENAVEAMRYGAYNYLIKPFSPDTIDALIDKAKEHASIVAENDYWRREQKSPPQVIGESPATKQLLVDLERIAATQAAVFIEGESGTGKEVVAHAIHYKSPRATKPFIKVNCAAIPESLIESEFFGHEKGAFTGANARRLGRFELAHGGTLLLDEVTEIPLALQAKLLRVIQEQEFERVGGSKPVKVDVRLIATSNRDIREAVAQKVFREDLYYRLNVMPLHLLPLRERREDILPLAHYFLSLKKPLKKLTPSAEEKLLNYGWPGNVRELANVIERATVLASDAKISAELLHLEGSCSSTTTLPVGLTLAELDRRFIIETLAAHQNNKTKAAAQLGISASTLRTKLGEKQKT